MLIRGVEVSSKEVADHTGLTRQHVLLGRTDRETGVERPGTTAQRYACILEIVSEPFNLLCRISCDYELHVLLATLQ